jgi:undecaprenyl-diphosphatase
MLNVFFLNSLDLQIAALFLARRTNFGIKLFSLISYFGNWEFIVPATLIVVWLLFLKNKKKLIVPFALTVIVGEIITFWGKIFFQRARPLSAVLIETDFSFPSGHATIAVTFYGYLAYILIKSTRGKYARLIVTGAILVMFLIGFSRLYLGVHYLSDVLAGYLVGLLVLIIGIKLTEKKF